MQSHQWSHLNILFQHHHTYKLLRQAISHTRSLVQDLHFYQAQVHPLIQVLAPHNASYIQHYFSSLLMMQRMGTDLVIVCQYFRIGPLLEFLLLEIRRADPSCIKEFWGTLTITKRCRQAMGVTAMILVEVLLLMENHGYRST